MQGDFNGDGLSDFMYLNTTDQWITKYAKKDGTFRTETVSSSAVLHDAPVLDWGRNMPNTWIKGEFNGDGRTDFMFLDSSATPTWHVMTSDGDGTFSEYYTEAQSSLTPSILDWGNNFPNSWQVGDFNGDRLTDFMYLGTDEKWRMRLAESQGGFVSQTPQDIDSLTNKILGWGGNFRNSWIKGDFNGDRRQDFMYLDTANNWQVRLSNGDGSFTPVVAGNLTENALDWGSSFPNSWLHGDFNGDGNQDFMYMDTAGVWQQVLSKGNGQFAKSPSNLTTPNILDWGANFPNSWLVADLNGDGKTDIRYLGTNSKWQTRLSKGDNNFIDKPNDTSGPVIAAVLDWGRNFPNT